MITHCGFTCKSVDTNWRQTFLSRVLFEYSTPSNMSHFYDSCIRLMLRKKKKTERVIFRSKHEILT